jgi:hypothetical protein
LDHYFQRPQSLEFCESSLELARVQTLLRTAWAGDSSAIREIKEGTSGPFEVRPSAEFDGLEMVIQKLWILVCFFFLRDRDKASFCANPNCSAPYFLKTRETQKYCDRSQCMEFAQRVYARDWARRERGKKKRR